MQIWVHERVHKLINSVLSQSKALKSSLIISHHTIVLHQGKPSLMRLLRTIRGRGKRDRGRGIAPVRTIMRMEKGSANTVASVPIYCISSILGAILGLMPYTEDSLHPPFSFSRLTSTSPQSIRVGVTFLIWTGHAPNVTAYPILISCFKTGIPNLYQISD